MEIPSSHQGIPRPPRKNSEVSLPARFEARYPIYGDFGGVAFLDYGNVFPGQWAFRLDDLKYAPGVGLRYDTIIGPVRFDVGYALNPEPGIRRVQFFISIGQAF